MNKWNFEQIIRYLERRLGIRYIDNIEERAFTLSNNIYQVTFIDNAIIKDKYTIILKDNHHLRLIYKDNAYSFKQLEAIIMNIKKNILPSVYEEVADRMLKDKKAG